jgi:hypothetical protein
MKIDTHRVDHGIRQCDKAKSGFFPFGLLVVVVSLCIIGCKIAASQHFKSLGVPERLDDRSDWCCIGLAPGGPGRQLVLQFRLLSFGVPPQVLA